MSILDYFRRGSPPASAKVAKERLQIIVAHERVKKGASFPQLQKEIMAVIAKYFNIKDENVKVEMETKGNTSVLELNIVLPNEKLESTKA